MTRTSSPEATAQTAHGGFRQPVPGCSTRRGPGADRHSPPGPPQTTLICLGPRGLVRLILPRTEG